MKKTAAVLAVVVALALTGCATTPEAAEDKNSSQSIESTSDVASTLVTKELAKNLPETVDKIAGVAETLIENAIKEGQ